MVYFAYGSNMLTARLVSRCPGAKEIGTAQLAGYLLRFDKGSKDGSGKGTLHSTSNSQDIIYGVLFDVPQSQQCDLDQAEKGYDRKLVRVEVLNSEPVDAETYIAQEANLAPNAIPYDWYMALLITGALSHDLPQTYVDSLRAAKARPDPDLNRPGRLEALRQLVRMA
jgi:gamma-glutamylcyclotransferase